MTLLLTILHLSYAYDTIILNGNDWYIRTNSSFKNDFQANVPGTIYTDLMRNNILNDTYYGWNPMNYQWVANQTWIYYKIFNITNTNILQNRVIQLTSDGIDTIAEIYINNILIFTCDNMYQRNWINIKSILKQYDNNITIIFPSKVKTALQLYETCNITTDGLCPPHLSRKNVEYGFDNFNYLRTEPVSFGWDWAPAFAQIGIYRDIYLQAYNDAVIRDVMIFTEPTIQHNFDTWSLKATVTIDSGYTNVMNTTFNNTIVSNNSIQITLKLYIDELHIHKYMNISIAEYIVTNFTFEIDNINNITLWWPNNWGHQKLYLMSVQLGENIPFNLSIGFRTIKLIQNPIQGGKSFYFEVNGKAIPIHGSNWVPIDSFYGDSNRVNISTFVNRFIALKQSNQNMIRVWGGGVFETNNFYNLADKYGIMIWHDMMFAGSNYWANSYYLYSIQKEIYDTIHRLQYHPSIAIWVGNNENGPFCANNSTIYSNLYFNSVLDIINALDSSRNTIVSSPCFGNETETQPCSDYDNTFYGDNHHYNYQNDCWNISLIIRCRFLSEFGYNSWPSSSTMRQYIPLNEQYYNSSLMINRNHHMNSQQDMIYMIKQHFNLPNNASNSPADEYKYMLYLSQVTQAYCYKINVEFLRSIRNDCTINISGCNMGTMYWQTADIWPGASPAAIDWVGNYKLVQYFVKNFYEKKIIVGFNNGTFFNFYAINDDLEFQCIQCNLRLIVYNYIDPSLTYEWSVSYDMKPESAIFIYNISHLEFLNQTGNVCHGSLNNCILRWIGYDNYGKLVASNWMFISSPKDTKAINPRLEIVNIEQKTNDKQEYVITISVEAFAVLVWLELAPELYGYFDDNGFLLHPMHDQNMEITFYSASNETTLYDVQKGVSIWSLFESGAFDNN
eukprot:218359_1